MRLGTLGTTTGNHRGAPGVLPFQSARGERQTVHRSLLRLPRGGDKDGRVAVAFHLLPHLHRAARRRHTLRSACARRGRPRHTLQAGALTALHCTSKDNLRVLFKGDAVAIGSRAHHLQR